MIQAEIGGGARVDPGTGVQRPGFMIRDFTLQSNRGERIAISDFRGRSSLLIVFPGRSAAMRRLLEDAALHGDQFILRDAMVVAVIPGGPDKETLLIPGDTSILVLHDSTHAAHKLSGAMDEDGGLVPLVYLTDRFGEVISSCAVRGNASPPSLPEIFNTLEFISHQCPECEPPEWPNDTNIDSASNPGSHS